MTPRESLQTALRVGRPSGLVPHLELEYQLSDITPGIEQRALRWEEFKDVTGPRRQDLLNDPSQGAGAAESILRLWARVVTRVIASALAACGPTESPSVGQGRPVVVLRGLAAVHPLGNPTTLMEAVAEQELREPGSGRAIPVVLLVPGLRPPGSSRTYQFLGREDLSLQFYRGEEV